MSPARLLKIRSECEPRSSAQTKEPVDDCDALPLSYFVGSLRSPPVDYGRVECPK